MDRRAHGGTQQDAIITSDIHPAESAIEADISPVEVLTGNAGAARSEREDPEGWVELEDSAVVGHGKRSRTSDRDASQCAIGDRRDIDPYRACNLAS